MKTREGFVSNSSTASFVMLGWKVPSKSIDYDDLYERLDDVKGSFMHFDERKSIWIGVEIMEVHSDDGYADDGEMSLTEATTRAKEIGKLAGIDVSQEPTLYFGTRSA